MNPPFLTRNVQVEGAPPFRRRLLMLAEALLNNPDTDFQNIASQLFETITGSELHRETDPFNGEDYLYRCDRNECKASLSVHPEVATFFTGWNNRVLHPRTFEQGTPHLSNEDLAQAIIENWYQFTNLNAFDCIHPDTGDAIRIFFDADTHVLAGVNKSLQLSERLQAALQRMVDEEIVLRQKIA